MKDKNDKLNENPDSKKLPSSSYETPKKDSIFGKFINLFTNDKENKQNMQEVVGHVKKVHFEEINHKESKDKNNTFFLIATFKKLTLDLDKKANLKLEFKNISEKPDVHISNENLKNEINVVPKTESKFNNQSKNPSDSNPNSSHTNNTKDTDKSNLSNTSNCVEKPLFSKPNESSKTLKNTLPTDSSKNSDYAFKNIEFKSPSQNNNNQFSNVNQSNLLDAFKNAEHNTTFFSSNNNIKPNKAKIIHFLDDPYISKPKKNSLLQSVNIFKLIDSSSKNLREKDITIKDNSVLNQTKNQVNDTIIKDDSANLGSQNKGNLTDNNSKNRLSADKSAIKRPSQTPNEFEEEAKKYGVDKAIERSLNDEEEEEIKKSSNKPAYDDLIKKLAKNKIKDPNKASISGDNQLNILKNDSKGTNNTHISVQNFLNSVKPAKIMETVPRDQDYYLVNMKRIKEYSKFMNGLKPTKVMNTVPNYQDFTLVNVKKIKEYSLFINGLKPSKDIKPVQNDEKIPNIKKDPLKQYIHFLKGLKPTKGFEIIQKEEEYHTVKKKLFEDYSQFLCIFGRSKKLQTVEKEENFILLQKQNEQSKKDKSKIYDNFIKGFAKKKDAINISENEPNTQIESNLKEKNKQGEGKSKSYEKFIKGFAKKKDALNLLNNELTKSKESNLQEGNMKEDGKQKRN